MTIKQRRIEKGWSQLQLAEYSGVSLRTIQRIEKGHTPANETIKSIASVFEIDFSELYAGNSHTKIDESKLNDNELLELEHIRNVQKFLRDLLFFLLSIPLILILNMIDAINGEWLLWTLVIWGGWLVWDAFDVFDYRDFFSEDWEKRMLEKRLGKKID